MKNHLSLLTLNKLLKPMGTIVSIIYDNMVLFRKNNIIFAKLYQDGLYFLNKAKKFYLVPSDLIKDSDNFLIAATRSYYFASGNNHAPL